MDGAPLTDWRIARRGGTPIGRNSRGALPHVTYVDSNRRAEGGSGSGELLASDFVSNHLDYATVRFYGDTAVAQGQETWTLKDGSSGRFVWIDTSRRRR